MLPALCLAAGALTTSLPIGQFTLRWQHSIEKVEWAEDYEVAGDWLHLSQARIRGSGAGMEPPPGAVLVDGIYRTGLPTRGGANSCWRVRRTCATTNSASTGAAGR